MFLCTHVITSSMVYSFQAQKNASVHHFLGDIWETVNQNTKDTTGAIWNQTNMKGVQTSTNLIKHMEGGTGPGQLVMMMIQYEY